MFRLSFSTNFRIFFFLFFAPAISITAQGTNIYKQLLKEPLKPDFMKPSLPLGKKDILESKAARVMVDVPGLVLFLISKAVKTPSINISSSKESKALKKAKSIKKDVYHIED